MHILIIEDDVLTSFAIKTSLERAGYSDISIVRTEDEAVAAAHHRCPDLIVADFNLKAGNGVSAIRSICSGREIPHFCVTGAPQSVLELHPTAIVLNKPFNHTLLVRTAARITAELQRSRPTEEGI